MEEGEGSGGGDGGPGERSLRSGVRRGGAPRQPQCITLGRLAPRHYAVRRRPRCPRLARRGAARGARGTREAQPRFAVSQRTRKMLAVSRLMDHFGKVLHHNGEGFAL